MAFPRHILDRIERVYAFHRATKLAFGPVASGSIALDLSSILDFPRATKVALPTTLVDAPLGALAVLESSVQALPDSFVSPPQDLKTLASWLHMAAGILRRGRNGTVADQRACPSLGDAFPTEIYVAAFALHDLDPGLYHFNPRSFSLHKLREGAETLAQIKRGRPDLEFIKRAPAALLVSTVYCRSTIPFDVRGYRTALLDAGQLVQNLVTTAGGLGIQTITRLRMTESTLRELIGVAPDASPMEEESVQSMVVWADRSQREAILTHVTNSPVAQAAAAAGTAAPHDPLTDSPPFGEPLNLDAPAAPAPRHTINEGGAAVASLDVPDLFLPTFGKRTLAPLERAPLTTRRIEPPASVFPVQTDCVAPGVAIREIRPPLTELSPLPDEYPCQPMSTLTPQGQGESLRSILLAGVNPRDFSRAPIPRDAFRTICGLAFGGGSYFPMFPEGPHAAFPRAFWVIHNVAGMDPGIWYHRPESNQWCLLREGGMRLETHVLAGENDAFANAAAVGFVLANFTNLLLHGGPDTYRLAHLEAGTVARRLALAAKGLHLDACATTTFFDDDVRSFLGLEKTGWDPLLMIAVGVPAESVS